MKFRSYLIIVFAFLSSCKKDNNIIVNKICTTDSIADVRQMSFQYKYVGDKISEVNLFDHGNLLDKITYLYSGSQLTGKKYFIIPFQKIAKEYVYKYKDDLLSSITEYKLNTTTSLFTKRRVSEFVYKLKVLSVGRTLFFDGNDTTNPTYKIELNFFGSPNADSALSNDLNFTSFKYEMFNKPNPLSKNYLFLSDPAIEYYGLLFDPLYFPFFLNDKYTFSYTETHYGEYRAQIRVDINSSGGLLFFYINSGGNYQIWDYYSKCN